MKGMKYRLAALVIGLLFSADRLKAADSFQVMAHLNTVSNGTVLTVSMEVPDHFYLYADRFQVTDGTGNGLTPVKPLPMHEKKDPFSGDMLQVLDHSFAADYPLPPSSSNPIVITVSYQGCNAESCFLPQREVFRFPVDRTGESTVTVEDVPDDQDSAADHGLEQAVSRFAIADTVTGYVPAKRFRVFLEEATSGERAPQSSLTDRSLWLAVLLILVGGLALNLTPCVLPMLPVNLAIIGAGVQAGSRRRGFLLGGAYGLGIALAYGFTGLLVVLTGSTFGGLNANAWFNGSIAALFLVMALAMFDVIHIDLTRFQRTGPSSREGGRLLMAMSMGMVSALLAGACVAPVVISVLIWSGQLYAEGHFAGLLLPFVLGAGMAFPWPFAGAGLSLLPRPGRWMVWIRNGFGVLILLLALYYAHQAYELSDLRLFVALADEENGSITPEQMNRKLSEHLRKAAEEGRPVLLDFGASWCKNCRAMEATTLQDPDVLKALEAYALIYYAAENPDDPVTKSVLNRFGVLGLPTYVILMPIDISSE